MAPWVGDLDEDPGHELHGVDPLAFGRFDVDPSTVLARIHNSFLTDEQKAKVLAGNLEALLARFPA
jgi:hypothetical protein